MGYHVRAFCTATETPTINTIRRSLRELGFDFTPQVDDSSELDSLAWQGFDLIYKVEKGPIVVECNRDDGDESLAKAECEEFFHEVANLDDTPAKIEVMEHLRKTRFIICCQLLSDIDDDGFEANGQFLGYFVDHCGGMIYADGEGFYEHMDLTTLFLPLK